MINLYANDELKKLGCKWTGSEWEAPKLAKAEADEIKRKYYSDLVVVEVTVNPEKYLKGKDWGYSRTRIIAGYIVASAKGRDSGAVIANDVAVITGKFGSGGSVKNFICDHTDELVLRLEVSQHALSLLDDEVEEGHYTYKLLSETKPVSELSKYTLEELLAEIELRKQQ